MGQALRAGDSVNEFRHVAVLAITACEFATVIAGTEWIEEVLHGPEAADYGEAGSGAP